MLDKDTLAHASSAIAALDLSAENDRLAELNAKLAEIGEAETTARERIAELDALIRGYREPDGDEVADAILAGDTATMAANAGASLTSLQDERARLFPALKALRHRNDDALAEVREVRAAAAHKASGAVAPLIDAIVAEARVAAERLAECYAAVSAAYSATQYFSRQRDALGEALHASRGLLDEPYRAVPVPASVVEVLKALVVKGPVLRSTVPETVPQPNPPIAPSVIGAIAVAAADQRGPGESAAATGGLQPGTLPASSLWNRVLGR
jgi:hypothetical protein